MYRQKIVDACESIHELLELDHELASYQGKLEYSDEEDLIALYRQDINDRLYEFEYFREGLVEFQKKQGIDPDHQSDVTITVSILALLKDNYMSKRELSDMLGVSLSIIERCMTQICVSHHIKVYQDQDTERYHIKLTSTPLFIL